MELSTPDLVRHGVDRFKQERLGWPIWKRIYRSLWGDGITILRELPIYMDRDLSIDVMISNPFAPPLHIQEKTLGYVHGKRFDTLTVEYMQNPEDGLVGDWSKIATQLYACAYLTEKERGFTHGVIVNWSSLVMATIQGSIPWRSNQNNDGRARASFKYVNISDIPDDIIVWRKIRVP